MSNQEYADLVLAEMAAHVAMSADPDNEQKFMAWYTAHSDRSRELGRRQARSFAERYPPTQFERVPDEGLL